MTVLNEQRGFFGQRCGADRYSGNFEGVNRALKQAKALPVKVALA
jgi:hypothetical protein